MLAGFLPLVFNPHAWMALAVAALLSFSGGVVKGWNWSQADQARAYARELEQAAADKDRIARLDAEQAERDRSELVRVEATLESALHEVKKTASAQCVFTEPELRWLRKLTTASR